MNDPKWKIGDRVKVNERYSEWREYIGDICINNVIYIPPKIGVEGTILDIDRQGDAWVSFEGGLPDGWPMNPDWADVIY